MEHHKCNNKCQEHGCNYKSKKNCHVKKTHEKKCHEKKCHSSSSSDDDCCDVPKVVYQACINHGIAKIQLTAVVETPNFDNPPTFTCPTAVGKKIIIRYTITNIGNVPIKSARYIYDSLTGVNKGGKCKLLPGESENVIAKHCITKCDCAGNLSISANAYIQFNRKNVILVSQPIAIQINKTA